LALFRQYNDIISLIDWMPTLCAAAGVADIREKMRNGFAAGNKTFRVHLDGYDFGPYFRGETGSGPRDALSPTCEWTPTSGAWMKVVER
jgi:hypothetical protein